MDEAPTLTEEADPAIRRAEGVRLELDGVITELVFYDAEMLRSDIVVVIRPGSRIAAQRRICALVRVVHPIGCPPRAVSMSVSGDHGTSQLSEPEIRRITQHIASTYGQYGYGALAGLEWRAS